MSRSVDAISGATSPTEFLHWALQPLRAGSLTISSRFVLAPVNTGFASFGVPRGRLLQFHRERSGPTLGISMVGNVAVDEDARTNSNTPVLHNQVDCRRFAVISRAIARAGSLPGIQLANAPSFLQPHRRWKATDPTEEIGRLRSLVGLLSQDAIELQLARFVQSCRLALDSGFAIIQIHAAHGYLLSLLADPSTNPRTDQFVWNGAWLESFVGEAKRASSPSLLSVRINALNGIADEAKEIEHAHSLTRRLVASGVDIVDLSAGMYTVTRRLIYPGAEHTVPVYSAFLTTIMGELDALFVIAGRFQQLDKIEMPHDRRLLFGLGRSLIADPRLVDKYANGEAENVVRCQLRNRCHYFSRGRVHLECGVNPNI
jgi:2,4-dienoyl-CoA reductase-like NADH-dependent reductase (Old Yellow Enzyme family)